MLLEKIYDNRRSDSWAGRLRSQRIAFLNSLIRSVPKPIKILDLGGRPDFWQNSAFLALNHSDVEITFLNIEPVDHPNYRCLIGDARNLARFKDNEFDVVFSNSVIEHLGDYKEQRKMAQEIQRVGQRYFVQTPNRYFPIEPHFLFPFFQFLPIKIKVWLLTHFNMGWYPKMSQEEARDLAVNTQLLSRQQFLALFPQANLYEEKVAGLTKSFITYDGW